MGERKYRRTDKPCTGSTAHARHGAAYDRIRKREFGMEGMSLTSVGSETEDETGEQCE